MNRVFILMQYGQVFTASEHATGIKSYVLLHAIPPHLYDEYRVMRVVSGGEVINTVPLKEFLS